MANGNLSGIGRLRAGVFLKTEGMPASGAVVRVTDRSGSFAEELLTDSSGQTAEIRLPAPPVDYSLDPEAPRPYEMYDLDIMLDGVSRSIIRGVQVFPNSTAIQDAVLEPALEPIDGDDVINIDPPTLWGDYPAKIPEEEIKELPPDLGFVVLPEPVVPEFIVVHDGAPTNKNAKNYWIPFKDYIKNVGSSEIYSTWPEATIRANILAILSFTLNRVYTEWYRGKGYDFTITSSTAFDHAFNYGRNIFSEISVVVDEIFTTFVTRPDIKQPLFTQYCDGRKSKCPNWMTQWGSKELGDAGYSAVDILRSFYGSDIFLMQAEKVDGVPVSFPGYVLQMGSQGPEVRTIQEQLNAISNNFPAIGKLVVDGYYGDRTRMSVETFQGVFNLPQSGMVDFATWYSISNVYVAVSNLAELV